jgi:glutaryl-CoA dehydrogenase (non-decarboxylating)
MSTPPFALGGPHPPFALGALHPPFALGATHNAARFRNFVLREIRPHVDRFDREERICASLITRLAEEQYLGAVIPVAYGGAGMDMVTLGILHEEVGRCCSSVRSLLTVQSMVAYALLKWGNQQQRAMWLPLLASGKVIGAFALSEAQAGSDVGAMLTVAARKGESFAINGRKKWTTFGQIASLFLVLGKYEGKISAFLVERDRPGLSIAPISGMLGVRASMLAELNFTNCEIPANNLIGTIGFGMTAVAGSALDLGRYSVACGCVGIAQACLDEALGYAEQRQQFGVPLSSHQLISAMLAQMVINVTAARLLCRTAGQSKEANDPKTVYETLIAKYFASTTAMAAASDAVQIHGAHGCSAASPVQRYLRDAKIMEIIEGSTQIQLMMIAKQAYAARGGAS